MKPRQRRHIIKVDNAEFVRAYLNSTTNWEVAEKLGVPETFVGQRSAYLRQRGVKLPKRYSAAIDENELNGIIEQHMKEHPNE